MVQNKPLQTRALSQPSPHHMEIARWCGGMVFTARGGGRIGAKHHKVTPVAKPPGHAHAGARGSDDSSAQGRGLSSATTFYLQAPPPTALPKPEHRPNCRCPVNNSRVVVGGKPSWRALGGMGGKEHRMLLSVTPCFCSTTTHNNRKQNDFFALFLIYFATYTCSFANPHSISASIRY